MQAVFALIGYADLRVVQRIRRWFAGAWIRYGTGVETINLHGSMEQGQLYGILPQPQRREADRDEQMEPPLPVTLIGTRRRVKSAPSLRASSPASAALKATHPRPHRRLSPAHLPLTSALTLCTHLSTSMSSSSRLHPLPHLSGVLKMALPLGTRLGPPAAFRTSYTV